MDITFESDSISKIIPPAKKILPAPRFISNNAGDKNISRIITTYGDASPVLINKGVTQKKIDDATWDRLKNDLLEFIKTTDSEAMKEVAEQAVQAAEQKDSGKFKKVLSAAGKIGLEIFSKVTGTVLAEFAKGMMMR